MGIFFEPNERHKCCLCGGMEALTGEHKIKASALRAEFGLDQMTIGTPGEPEEQLRLAQGPKSKEFHFTAARICSGCNGKLTQPADREFERFHKEARAIYDRGENPKRVFEIDRYSLGTAAYFNVFRYFAKLLCCHMAEISGPRRLLMTRFALGQSNLNCVWLYVDEDLVFKEFSPLGSTQYAAHGGLGVYDDKNAGGATTFQSTLSFGPLRYTFTSRLNVFEKWALTLAHPAFYAWYREKVNAAKKDQSLMKIG